jgi:phosphoribosylformylglycinamidine synthase
MENQILWYPVANGEGKFIASPEVLERIEAENLIAFRYVDEKGNPTQEYPFNPNGSTNAIVGITDTTGRILGLMPHPECFVRVEQHPNWRRGEIKSPHGFPLFENIVKFVAQ